MSLLYHSSTRLIRPNLMEELQTTQKEILVAGGSSALIEFVILVYRFAIKYATAAISGIPYLV